MSGGLDSTWAAVLLKEAGHEVVGCALRMHAHTPMDRARLAAEQAGVALVELDAAEAFEEQVVCPFAREYARGRTPNPCVRCNRLVKLKTLCDYAERQGFDAVATGHYAHVERDGESGRYYIRPGRDEKKDQSYALYGLTQQQLAMLILPLAGMDKASVRRAAAAAGLQAASSPESMENCFIPDGHYSDFLSERGVCPREGDFIDPEGRVLGRHRGITHYTVGQRKGLGISLGRVAFVTAIDPEKNTVTLGDESELMKDHAEIGELSLQRLAPAPATLRAEVKIRYGAPPVPATVTVFPDADRAEIRFDRPVRALTPGQSAVCYDERGAILLGGVIR